ncbi:MAG: bifunctional folylpolyglutamate synthase/dihydrofolate synthase, partial [Candidatus Hydrothermia bacterium]
GYTKSLEPFLELLEKLGRPHQAPGRKIIIAGTKGKGSVAAHLTQGLLNAGRTVGTYTSPHLIDTTERILLNGSRIRKEELARFISEIKPHIIGRRGMATWFEAMTAAAFVYFRERAPEFWVLEVGLGGRLDATNAVRQDLTLITRIGLDHTNILGNTLAEIAREKCGVIKGGVVITCRQEPEAMEVIRATCEERGADLVVTEYSLTRSDLGGTRIAMSGREYHTPLLGRFQAENLALSAAGLIGLGIAEPDFSGTTHPGRFQVIPEEIPIILDGAHNPLALLEVISETRRLFPDKGFVVVFGASRGKDVGAMLRLLTDARLVILTRARTPRAAEPFLLEPAAREIGLKAIKTKGVAEALERAREMAGVGDAILVTGSLYVVGEALEPLGSPDPLSIHSKSFSINEFGESADGSGT